MNIRVRMDDAQAVSKKIRETVSAINAEIREDSPSETLDELSTDERRGFVDIVLSGEIIETLSVIFLAQRNRPLVRIFVSRTKGRVDQVCGFSHPINVAQINHWIRPV